MIFELYSGNSFFPVTIGSMKYELGLSVRHICFCMQYEHLSIVRIHMYPWHVQPMNIFLLISFVDLGMSACCITLDFMYEMGEAVRAMRGFMGQLRLWESLIALSLILVYCYWLFLLFHHSVCLEWQTQRANQSCKNTLSKPASWELD